MREIEKQQDMLPDMKVKIGESLNNLNETIDLLLENIILSARDSDIERDNHLCCYDLDSLKRVSNPVQSPILI